MAITISGKMPGSPQKDAKGQFSRGLLGTQFLQPFAPKTPLNFRVIKIHVLKEASVGARFSPNSSYQLHHPPEMRFGDPTILLQRDAREGR